MQTAEHIDGLPVAAIDNSYRKAEHNRHNPGLRALLSIKNFSTTLEKDFVHLVKIEKDLNDLNKAGLAIIKEHAPESMQPKWSLIADNMNKTIAELNKTINNVKNNIEKKGSDDSITVWTELSLQLRIIKDQSQKAIFTGLEILPPNNHSLWETKYQQEENSLMESFIEHVENCRVLLQMIERYSPDELNKISKIIVDQIPPEYTYEEAEKYESDYYKSLVNFKKEFKEEKNMWDKFLDILAGGTHQTPSERVMLERWIEGEKGTLD